MALGGAIYSTNTIGAKEASSLSMTKIIGTVFSHNSAIGAGGAIYILNQQFTLINTDFLSNKAFSINKFFSDSPSQGGALWYSGSKLKGSIFNCEFHNNTAHGGWAGAIFATEYSMLDVKDSGFTGNAAISSYTNTAQGGAIMISSSSSISVVRTKFLANAALPEARISPQTYSGEGGAIYAQSSALFFDDCQFRGNYAITGQFDAGSAGGAMLLEDCYPSVIKRSNFVRNGAPGYLGKSSYASQGRGGCIYIKFSATEITDCLFDSNWVSAGGKEASFGGAVAINFDYSSVSSGAMNGVSINNTVFRNNSAFGQICFRTQSGQGGAIGVIGAAKPPVSLFNVNFTNNKVQSASDTTEISAGGAIAITYNSNITAGNCHFHRNVAFLGIGNDIASVATSDNTDFNSLSFADSHFHAASVIELNSMYQQLEDFGNDVCQTVQTCINNATSKCNQYDIFETLSSRRRRRLSSTSVQTRFDLPEYFQAFQWLHIDFNEEDEMVLTLFDRYPIVVAKVSDEEAWSNEKLLIRLVKALRQFQATPDASVTEKLMKVLEIYIRDLENIMLSQSSRDDFETSRRTTSDDPAVVAKDHHIYSRSLSGKNRFDTEGSLLVLSFFRPDIVVTSGYGILTNPTFTGPYHIFCGDYTSFQSQRYSKNTIHHDVPVSFFSELELLGNVEAEQLTLTIVEATVVFDMPMKSLDTMDIQQVNIFNGSLKLSNNIAVSKTSYLFESKIYGTGVSESVDRFSVNANISFIKGLYVGYGLSALFNDNSGTLRDVIDNQNFNRMKANDTVIQTEIAFSSCNIVLAGVMYLDSPFRNYNSTNLLPVPNSIVRLYDNATMFVSANGSVVVLTNTLIDGSKSISPAVINTGNISLIGSTVVLLDQLSDAEVNNVPKFVSNSASQGSLGSSLTIRGTYVQTEVGLVYLTLNSSYQNYPVLNLESDQYLDGSFVVDFYTPGTSATDDGDAVSSANLILYDTNKPSTFTFATYADYTGHNVAQINAPIGLKFSSNVLPLSSVEENNQPDPNKLQNYGQTLQIQNIGCNVISKYYYGVADVPIESKYPCHICLMNSSCDYCGSLGTCQIGGTCGGNQVYTDNCCSGNCMEPYGHCEIDNDSSMNTYSYICRCNWFYSGGDCHDVSTFGYITIFSCAFLVVSAVLIVVLYRRALIQKKKVLDELREGILRHTESGNNEYIQHMQQALILNDVFVKFEEIKLESQIGEGSFGVVHRATFRGAQVAVKQMRSMFIELTEKEIEEFRKEAYMMSRYVAYLLINHPFEIL